MKLNYYTLLIFAPVLVLTGVLGFILPENLMSNALSYDIFHLVFMVIGAIFVISRREIFIQGFNLIFGAIDLYQALELVTRKLFSMENF